MGQIYQGRKGEYTIIQDFPGKFPRILVEYVSGPWKGKQISMSKATHNKIQENIGVEKIVEETLEKQEIEDKLDLWFEKYPNLYKTMWYEGITGTVLLEKLENEYPDAGSNVNLEVSRW